MQEILYGQFAHSLIYKPIIINITDQLFSSLYQWFLSLFWSGVPYSEEGRKRHMDKEKKKLTHLGHRHDSPSDDPFNHRDRCLLTLHRYLEFQLLSWFFVQSQESH